MEARSNKRGKLKGVEDKELKDVAGGGRDPEGQHRSPRMSEAPLELETTSEDATLVPTMNVVNRNS